MQTNSKHHTCESCRKKWTVEFRKNETQKQVTCPNEYCGKIQIVKPKVNQK
jgi:hypothetical protein